MNAEKMQDMCQTIQRILRDNNATFPSEITVRTKHTVYTFGVFEFVMYNVNDGGDMKIDMNGRNWSKVVVSCTREHGDNYGLVEILMPEPYHSVRIWADEIVSIEHGYRHETGYSRYTLFDAEREAENEALDKFEAKREAEWDAWEEAHYGGKQ